MLKKFLLIALVGLSLGGCEDRETSRARNEQKLPPGCKIIDLDYGDLTSAVVCDGRKTTSSAKGWDTVTYVTNANGITTPIITHYNQVSVTIEAQNEKTF